jgi:hypothetical protein
VPLSQDYWRYFWRAALGALFALALAACPGEGAREVVAPTVDARADAGVRRPDGVVVEPPPAMPTPASRAEARGVVALREPLGTGAIHDVLTALVDAFERKALDAAAQLLAADATALDARGRGGRAMLVESWRVRMQQHDYSRLVGLEVFRTDKIERFDFDELGRADTPARPLEMRPGDVFVRVPIETARVAGERFFGDTITLLFRREDARWKIGAFGETETP